MVGRIFPSSWYRPDKAPMVIEFLANLPIAPEDKKYAFLEWAKWAGYKPTREDIERLTGLKAGTV